MKCSTSIKNDGFFSTDDAEIIKTALATFEETDKSFIQLLQEQDEEMSRFFQPEENEAFDVPQFKEDDTNSTDPIQLNPDEIGDAAGDLVTQIINNLLNENGTIDLTEPLTALVDAIGPDAIETAVSWNGWYYLCVATWWPLDDEHCNQAR